MDYNLENSNILIVCILFIVIMNVIGYLKKKSTFPMITLIFFMASLIVHFLKRDALGEAFRYNVYADLIVVGISITNLLIVDEIETRRTMIKRVFENRYQKSKKNGEIK